MGKRTKRNLKVCNVECHWEDCQWMVEVAPSDYQTFSDHVKVHADEFITRLQTDKEGSNEKPVGCCCMWRGCAWEGCGDFMDLLRHVMYHGYHALLKALGKLVQTNMKLATCRIEMEDAYSMLLNSAIFTCQWDNCSTEYTCPNQFYRHVEKHVMDSTIIVSDVDGGTTVKCYWKNCDDSFRNKYKLKEHVRVHTHEKLIACPDCGGMFANQTKLLDHLSRQNPEAYESFQCSHCLKRCASERLLRDHMRHHVNYLKCPHCDMTCPNAGSLKYHIAYRHTNERPYACAMCEQSFKSQSDLVRHEESHLMKSYLCDVKGCSYATKTQHCLRRHIRIMHMNTEKRYICHICNSEYSRGFGLTKHLKKKHNFSWPSGHPRFRYIQYEDGFYRLQMVRFESVELTKRLQQNDGDNEDVEDDVIGDSCEPSQYNGDYSAINDLNEDTPLNITTESQSNAVDYFQSNVNAGNEIRDNVLYTSVAFQTQVDNSLSSTTPDSSGYVFIPSAGLTTHVKEEIIETTNKIIQDDATTASPSNIVATGAVSTSRINTSCHNHENISSNTESSTGQHHGELLLQPKPKGYDKTVMAQLVTLINKQSYPCPDKNINNLYGTSVSNKTHHATSQEDNLTGTKIPIGNQCNSNDYGEVRRNDVGVEGGADTSFYSPVNNSKRFHVTADDGIHKRKKEPVESNERNDVETHENNQLSYMTSKNIIATARDLKEETRNQSCDHPKHIAASHILLSLNK